MEYRNPPGVSHCCQHCFKETGGVIRERMIGCGTCGNKRCPKATNHELVCTGSNAPGQPGSDY